MSDPEAINIHRDNQCRAAARSLANLGAGVAKLPGQAAMSGPVIPESLAIEQNAWMRGEIDRLYEALNEKEVREAAAVAKVAEQEATIADLEKMFRAQEEKYRDCPHAPSDGHSCACADEDIGDTCMLHSPMLNRQQAIIERLTETLDKSKDDLEDNVAARALMRIRAALEGKWPFQKQYGARYGA